MRKLPKYQYCFICGQNNKAGTNITWMDIGDSVHGEYIGKQIHIGYEGIIHGGILSSLLDECIGWAVVIREKKIFVTVELKIKYKEIVPVGKKLIINGFYANNQPKGKAYRIGIGTITDDEDKIYATGEGKFFPILQEFELPFIEKLTMPDDINKIVTREDLWGKTEKM